MAALFRGSRNLLLGWNKHVGIALGKVLLMWSVFSSVSVNECVQKRGRAQAEHCLLLPVS